MTTIRFGAAMAMAVAMMVLSGCTVTLPEHGHPLAVGPAANPSTHERAPAPAPMAASTDRVEDNRTAWR
jgi:hypothetical protein